MSRYVYLMTCPERVKIGHSSDPFVRLTTLRKQTGLDLWLEAMVVGTRADEAFLHREFQKHWIEGEWFHPSPAILNWFLSHVDYINPGVPRDRNWMPERKRQLLRAKEALGQDVPKYWNRSLYRKAEVPRAWIKAVVEKATGSPNRKI